jgi:GT2 family glycosyltransferase
LLVCADGCTDGTADFVREQYPNAILIEHPQSRGSIRSRIALMEACSTDIAISLDDDSYPVERDFIASVRDLFTSHPRVAVASFPQRTDEFPDTLTVSDFGPGRYVANYADSAAAFRRSVYFELEGWPPEFHHAYEEPDYALQCLAAGHAVYYDTRITVRHHFTSLERNEIRTHQRHARNEQWSAWRRCPFPAVLAVSPLRALSQLNYARKRGLAWIIREPAWWLAALRGLPNSLAKRRPVSWRVYRNWLRLIRHPIESHEAWEAAFADRAK